MRFPAGTAQSAGSANIANGSVSLDMLSQDVKSQINAPIGLEPLICGSDRQVGSEWIRWKWCCSRKSISPFRMVSLLLLGIRFISRGTPKELVWEEKAPVSVGVAYDGVEVLDGKIYFVGGYNGSA